MAGVLIGVAVLLGASAAWGQQRAATRVTEPPELAPFRMTGIEGYLLSRYWQDDNQALTWLPGAGTANGFKSTQKLSNLSGEVFVMTHSYVYHPNLLLLDLGAGPAAYRQSYASDGVETTMNKLTYNLSGRATFLRDKPYRGGLFYEQKNDSQPVGPAQSLLTANTRYGFDAALLAPVTPVPLRVDASRYHSQGKGTDQVIDDRVDEFNFRAERNYGKLGASYFHYRASRDDSRSGSLGLPIQAASTRINRADLDTNLTFGVRNEYDFTNTVSLSTQNYSAAQGAILDTRELRFDVNLRGRLSDALQTRARYQFDAYDQSGQTGNQAAKLNALNAGVTYQANPDLSGTLDATGTFNRNSTFAANQGTLTGSAQYRHAFAQGDVAANYGFTYTRRDQNAAQPLAQVVGERATLAGTNWVTTRYPQVVTSTVVVSNLTRTQTFVEGLDYALSRLGVATKIQRLIGGNILDGQEVLIDYEYDTGGSYGLAEFDNSAGLGWSWKSYFSVYYRYFDSAPRLLSGLPTAPLNPVKSTIYGSRADVPLTPLLEQFQVGGLAEWEDRREVISPYRRRTFEAYTELPLPLIARGALRVAARRQNTAYAYTPDHDVEDRTYTAGLWSRFRNGIDLSIEATRTRDTGSPLVAREYKSTVAKARWRVRRVLTTLEVTRTREAQGTRESTRTHGQFQMRRDF